MASTPGKSPRRGARPPADTPPPVPADWRPRASGPAELAALVERLPEEPGVYVMRDRRGEIVYVGKAHRLRARVRQYFSGHDTRAFVPLLGHLLGDIETVVTATDKEALLLENTLIKAHRPRFNVKLRDDKHFLVLRLDPRARWPRLELVRRVQDDGAHYFGPYHSAQGVRHTLRVVNRHFKLRTCSDFTLDHRRRPCLQHQIGRCPAPCVFEVDEAAYDRQVREALLFLDGRGGELLRELRARMEAAADDLDFEVAARLRDRIAAIETSLEGQRVIGGGDLDQDVIGMYREGGQVEFAVLHVRQGKLVGSRTYSQRGMELPDPEVLHSFLAAYYGDAPLVPDEVILPFALADDDAAPLAAWLRDQVGRKVAVLVPVRGDRRKLVALAQRNALSSFTSRRDRRQDSEEALAQLQARLGLSRRPRVIECFDISHIQGSDAVASMVVFVDGEPAKRRYRSFKIKGLGGALAQGAFQNDDFASMAEVLGRRLRRALAAGDAAHDPDDPDDPAGESAQDVALRDGMPSVAASEAPAPAPTPADASASPSADVAPDDPDDPDADPDDGADAALRDALDEAEAADEADDDDDDDPDDDPGAADRDDADPWALPDLIVIDGGKGQLSRVLAAIEAMGITIGAGGLDVVALAKERQIDLGNDRRALDRLRAHKVGRASTAKAPTDLSSAPGIHPPPAADPAPSAAAPGATYQQWVVDNAAVEGPSVAEDASPSSKTHRPERVFVPGRKDPIVLRPGSSELFLITRLRDEAHRFAITHHRRRRGKRALRSELDAIPGLGPTLRKALLKKFGSVEAIRGADLDALQEVKGIGARVAQRIREALHGPAGA